jgi:hypothetical protein
MIEETENTSPFDIVGQSLRRAVAVASRDSPDFIQKVVLITDESCLTLTADDDLDLLDIDLSKALPENCSEIPFSFDIIADCIGLVICFVWVLVGEDGRHDAMQIQFFTREDKIIQFVTIASEINIYNVTRLL